MIWTFVIVICQSIFNWELYTLSPWKRGYPNRFEFLLTFGCAKSWLIIHTICLVVNLDITNPHDILGGIEYIGHIGNYLKYYWIYIMWNYYWFKGCVLEPYYLEHKVNNVAYLVLRGMIILMKYSRMEQGIESETSIEYTIRINFETKFPKEGEYAIPM